MVKKLTCQMMNYLIKLLKVYSHFKACSLNNQQNQVQVQALKPLASKHRKELNND